MRQQYIDILKGFTIIWVLWMHMNLPELIYPSVQMPIFFFLSGCFYRAKGTFYDQIKGDAYRILLPTVCFMTIAAILMTLRGDHFWSWDIINVLQACRDSSITWFLIALFCYRAVNYPFEKSGHKWWYLILAAILYPVGYIWKVKFSDINIPIIPLNEMFLFGIYYVLGYTFGKRTLELSSNLGGGYQTVTCFVCTAYLVFVHNVDWESGMLSHIPWLVYGFPYTLCCIYLGLVICRYLERSYIITKPLAYVGKNSIVFYLTHWPLWMFLFKPLEWNIYMVFVIITLLEFLLISIMTNYLPWMIGLKKK